MEGEWIHHERGKNAPIDKAYGPASRYIGGVERSVSRQIDKRSEADSRDEPHLQEPLQCPAKMNAISGLERSDRNKDWLLR